MALFSEPTTGDPRTFRRVQWGRLVDGNDVNVVLSNAENRLLLPACHEDSNNPLNAKSAQEWFNQLPDDTAKSIVNMRRSMLHQYRSQTMPLGKPTRPHQYPLPETYGFIPQADFGSGMPTADGSKEFMTGDVSYPYFRAGQRLAQLTGKQGGTKVAPGVLPLSPQQEQGTGYPLYPLPPPGFPMEPPIGIMAMPGALGPDGKPLSGQQDKPVELVDDEGPDEPAAPEGWYHAGNPFSNFNYKWNRIDKGIDKHAQEQLGQVQPQQEGQMPFFPNGGLYPNGFRPPLFGYQQMMPYPGMQYGQAPFIPPGMQGMGMTPGMQGMGMAPGMQGMGISPGMQGMGMAPGMQASAMSNSMLGMNLNPGAQSMAIPRAMQGMAMPSGMQSIAMQQPVNFYSQTPNQQQTQPLSNQMVGQGVGGYSTQRIGQQLGGQPQVGQSQYQQQYTGQAMNQRLQQQGAYQAPALGPQVQLQSNQQPPQNQISHGQQIATHQQQPPAVKNTPPALQQPSRQAENRVVDDDDDDEQSHLASRNAIKGRVAGSNIASSLGSSSATGPGLQSAGLKKPQLPKIGVSAVEDDLDADEVPIVSGRPTSLPPPVTVKSNISSPAKGLPPTKVSTSATETNPVKAGTSAAKINPPSLTIAASKKPEVSVSTKLPATSTSTKPKPAPLVTKKKESSDEYELDYGDVGKLDDDVF